MRLVNIIKLLILSILISNCKDEKKTTTTKVTKIDFSESYKSVGKIDLSEIAAKIEYIPLESTSSLILDEIDKPDENIKFFNNSLLIRDRSDELYMFNLSGKFLNKIGSKGKGPEEYPQIQNIEILSQKKLIAVYSSMLNKVLLYKIDGSFYKDFKIDFWPLGLVSFKDDLIFANTLGIRNYSDYNTLSFVSTDGKIKAQGLHKSKEIDLQNKIKLGVTNFKDSGYPINNKYHYFENSSYEKDIVYEINSNYNIIPKYEIEIGGVKLPLEKHTQSNLSDFEQIIKFNKIESFFETTNDMFISVYYAQDKHLHNIYYNKTNNESKSVKFRKTSGGGFIFGFNNDIDGGLPFWPDGRISEDKLYMLINGYVLKDYLARKKINSDKKQQHFVDNNLNKISENSKIADNPILVIVTLKDKHK
ncbi:6-bladed beta-propeller [Flavobacterium magnesitis]|uniref:6-bladed beta-propeller n=1 Tax=Flavobacterium magnesitis TaxID=3138077 RepID=UPI00358FEF21